MTADEDVIAEIALKVVLEQAEDEGLWFRAVTITEQYLQAALRRLHAAVEADQTREALSRVGGREAWSGGYPKCCACGKEIRTFTNTTMCMGTAGMMQQESWQTEIPSGRVACIGCKFPVRDAATKAAGG